MAKPFQSLKDSGQNTIAKVLLDRAKSLNGCQFLSAPSRSFNRQSALRFRADTHSACANSFNRTKDLNLQTFLIVENSSTRAQRDNHRAQYEDRTAENSPDGQIFNERAGVSIATLVSGNARSLMEQLDCPGGGAQVNLRGITL
jgi:hypothetical protein